MSLSWPKSGRKKPGTSERQPLFLISTLIDLTWFLWDCSICQPVFKCSSSWGHSSNTVYMQLCPRKSQPTIPGDRDLAVSNIKSCVNQVNHWMLVSHHKLNKDRTELLAFSVKYFPRPLLQDISVADETIHFLQYRCNISKSFLINKRVAIIRICKSLFLSSPKHQYHCEVLNMDHQSWITAMLLYKKVTAHLECHCLSHHTYQKAWSYYPFF